MIDTTKMDKIVSLFKREAYPYYSSKAVSVTQRWQDQKFRQLLNSLSDKELEYVISQLQSDLDYCPYKLIEMAEGIHKYRERLSSDAIPLQTLLRLYTDKTSGKVNVSMKELMSRYSKVCAEDQRVILKAFLSGGKKEVEWAGRRLRGLWVRSLETSVGECWKRTHNLMIAKVILRHMPEAFIISEQEELAKTASYREVCGRLCNEKNFEIDRKRLSVPDYLYVLAKQSSKARILNTSYDIDRMLDEYFQKESYLDEDTINILLWSLGKLRMTETILHILPELEIRQQTSDIVDDLINRASDGFGSSW